MSSTDLREMLRRVRERRSNRRHGLDWAGADAPVGLDEQLGEILASVLESLESQPTRDDIRSIIAEETYDLRGDSE